MFPKDQKIHKRIDENHLHRKIVLKTLKYKSITRFIVEIHETKGPPLFQERRSAEEKEKMRKFIMLKRQRVFLTQP